MSDMILEKSRAVFSQLPFRDSRGDNASTTDALEDLQTGTGSIMTARNPNLESKVVQRISHCQCLHAVWGVKKITLLILDFSGQTKDLYDQLL